MIEFRDGCAAGIVAAGITYTIPHASAWWWVAGLLAWFLCWLGAFLERP